jgi:hypothetical protein
LSNARCKCRQQQTLKERHLKNIAVLTLDLRRGEWLYLRTFRTKIDITNKYCKGNCVFLDLFLLHNVGRTRHLQPARRVRPVKKFILSHDVVSGVGKNGNENREYRNVCCNESSSGCSRNARLRSADANVDSLCSWMQHESALCSWMQRESALCSWMQHESALCSWMQCESALCSWMQLESALSVIMP